MKRGSILIVDDEELIRVSLCSALKGFGYEVLDAESGEKALDHLRNASVDLVILDLIMGGMGGFDLLKIIKKELPDVEVMVITAFSSIETAVKSIRLGAFDYLPKPFNLDEVVIKVGKALETRKLQNDLRKFKAAQQIELEKEKLIYRCKAMEDVVRRLRKVVDSDVNPVLITGETGTGKDLVSRAIHLLSPRAREPYVTLNCNAVPSNLLESELFGHEKGSFTSAFESRKGLIEQAEGGSLFLDEIGDLDINLQGKMLRFLEDRTIRRIGARKELRTDVKLVAATNKDLYRAVKEGAFRADLFHRINLVNIDLPPLRNRKEDIPMLAGYFLELYSRKHGKKVTGFTDEAMSFLVGYPWPGNVRELRNLVEQILIFEGEGDLITREMITGSVRPFVSNASDHDSFAVDQLIFQKDFAFRDFLHDISKRLIQRALEHTNHNKVKAAKLLKIDRSTLNYQIKTLNLE
ncbi:MAG: sigma-54 dependent transcriptional regulator [Thermodesulfobacteriota bacterium]